MEDITSKELYYERERSILIGWVIGVFSIVPDIIATVLSGSVTMLTDVLRTGSDTTASFLSWLIVRHVSHGKTVDPQYGSGRMENLASLGVAGAMIISFAIVVISACVRFRYPHHLLDVRMAICFTIAAGLCNGWLWQKNYRLAQRQTSPIMESQWRLYRAKTTINACVLLALSLGAGLRAYHWAAYIDPAASLVLAFLLVVSVYQLISMSVYDLMDRALEDSLQVVIRNEMATVFNQAIELHEVTARRTGSRVTIEILLHVDSDRTMGDIQRVIDTMHADLIRRVPGSEIIITPVTTADLPEVSSLELATAAPH
ncbi:MAG: cation diffusion facilitator family transporter [Armatimonadota bacterium]